VTTCSAALFGVVPALGASSRVRGAALRQQARISAGPARHRLNRVLVVSEIALALVLLAAAGLLVRSFWRLSRVDPGFEPRQVVTLRTTLPESRYDSDERLTLFARELLRRLDGAPGLHAVGLVDYLPLSRTAGGAPFEIEGRPPARPDERPGSIVSTVGGRYFEAMGIPLIRGRLPDDRDTERSVPVVVVDEALERRFWPDGDAVGARITWREEGDRVTTREVIGVVRSVRWTGLSAPAGGTTYFWLPQDPKRQLTVVARTSGPAAPAIQTLASAVSAVDPTQPAADRRLMGELVSDDLARPRLTMQILGGFAVVALLLAAIGLYGVIACAVAERTREIGIRVALGAERRDLIGLVMRQGLTPVVVGLGLGAAVVLVLGRLVQGLLYDLTPYDPASLLLAAAVLGSIASIAAYVPARTASRLNPVHALRAE
jgi:putative ABC transport system permease protein